VSSGIRGDDSGKVYELSGIKRCPTQGCDKGGDDS